MAEAAQRESLAEGAELPAGHQPYIPDSATIPEFTWSAVLVAPCWASSSAPRFTCC